MKMNKLGLGIGMMAAIVASNAFAYGPEISGVSSGGTGCGASVGHDYDAASGDLQLSIPGVRPEVKRGGDRSLERLSCIVSIPVQAPLGFAVEIVEASIPVSTYIQSGGKSSAQTELFFAGSSGPILEANFENLAVAPITRFSSMSAHLGLRSGCGQGTIVRMNLSAFAQNSANRNATVAIAVRKANIKLALVPCSF